MGVSKPFTTPLQNSIHYMMARYAEMSGPAKISTARRPTGNLLRNCQIAAEGRVCQNRRPSTSRARRVKGADGLVKRLRATTPLNAGLPPQLLTPRYDMQRRWREIAYLAAQRRRSYFSFCPVSRARAHLPQKRPLCVV